MAKNKTINSTSAHIAQRPVTYEGNVTVKVQRNGRTVKKLKTSNSGTMLLFLGLGRFLADQFSNKSNTQNMSHYIPRYLGIGYQPIQTATDPLKYSLFGEYDIGSRIILTTGNIKVDSQAKTVTIPFTATVPYSTIGSRTITEIGLFSTEYFNDDTMLARVNIPPQEGSDVVGVQLEPGTNFLVEWNVVIQNML